MWGLRHFVSFLLSEPSLPSPDSLSSLLPRSINRPCVQLLVTRGVTYTIGIEVDSGRAQRAIDYTKQVCSTIGSKHASGSQCRFSIIHADVGQVRSWVNCSILLVDPSEFTSQSLCTICHKARTPLLPTPPTAIISFPKNYRNIWITHILLPSAVVIKIFFFIPPHDRLVRCTLLQPTSMHSGRAGVPSARCTLDGYTEHT